MTKQQYYNWTPADQARYEKEIALAQANTIARRNAEHERKNSKAEDAVALQNNVLGKNHGSGTR